MQTAAVWEYTERKLHHLDIFKVRLDMGLQLLSRVHRKSVAVIYGDFDYAWDNIIHCAEHQEKNTCHENIWQNENRSHLLK